jgi:hypothetical protein
LNHGIRIGEEDTLFVLSLISALPPLTCQLKKAKTLPAPQREEILRERVKGDSHYV